MTDLVYHYTDTARLPWILVEGSLKPGRNQLGGFPDPDFLWATTLPIPDRTASASQTALRKGLTRLVRFTLAADDFEAWPEIVQHFPAWTPDQVARLDKAARGKSDPRCWRCRAEPLPTAAWVSVETRGWSDRAWCPLDPRGPCLTVIDADTVGMVIGGTVYISQKVAHPSGAYAYSVDAWQHARAS